MKEVRLNNGVMMPAIGFGVYQIPAADTERTVSEALETGYRMIDTAASYFNEEQVGNAIRHSALKREEVFVATKLWVQDYEYDDALRAFDKSAKLLGLDYINLYMLQAIRQLLCRLACRGAALQGGPHTCHRRYELFERAVAGPFPAQRGKARCEPA